MVERVRLEALLAELKLSSGDFIDPLTAAKNGKGLGARYLVTGSISAVRPSIHPGGRSLD